MNQGLAALKAFAAPRPKVERCDLCHAPVAERHPHLYDGEKHTLRCLCVACGLLYSAQPRQGLRLVESHAKRLTNVVLDDALWDALSLPIQLAFFVGTEKAPHVEAYYPSPAGATLSALSLAAWDAVLDANPALRDLKPDVEALLVNRLGNSMQYYRVSIDHCYALVGLVRTHWRGFSGGAEVWAELEAFFAQLEAPHA